MSTDVLSLLQSFGLTRTQAQIFIYLTRMGASSISILSNALKTNRMNIYRNLRKMQNIGLVNVIPGRPMKFSAVPAAAALEALLSAARNKVLEMENMYSQALEELSKLSSQREEYVIEMKFRLHCGRRNVYSVMMQMLENSKREVCLFTTPSDLIRMSFYGLSDILKRLYSRGVKIKILTNIMDKKLASDLGEYMKYAVLRHSNMDIKTRFLITDGEAAFTSLSVDDTTGLDSESDSGFWTDSPHYVQSMKIFFEAAWCSAQDASVTLWYLRTGKPMEKITVFSSVDEYHARLVEMVNRAEKEVLICIMRFKEPFISGNFVEVLKTAYMRGVKIRVLTTINGETDVLRNLLEVADIRHVRSKHIHMDFMTTDAGESLFCFPVSFIDENKFQMLYLWSNSIVLSKISNELFTDLWYRSINSSIRLREMRFKKAMEDLPKVLEPLVAERGWIFHMPATMEGKSGLKQSFDIALIVKSPKNALIVGDVLPEESNIKMALISLYVKAIDVGANQKILIMPSGTQLSSDENEIATAYDIKLIEGLEVEEIGQKVIEKIMKLIFHN